MATEPMTLQLRYLQTLAEIGVEKNTTIVFPLPLELLTLFNKSLNRAAADVTPIVLPKE
jgi:hypothetical protein